MLFEIAEADMKKAKTPHELSMLNLVAFHLLGAPAAIALNHVLHVDFYGFLLPLGLSLSFIAFLWFRVKYGLKDAPWFVAMHWRLSANRTRVLLVGYAITATILGFAFLVTSGSSKAEIMMVALSRVAAVPVLVTVMICFVLEQSAIYQAGRGEVPDGLVKRFPPQAGLSVRETQNPDEGSA